MSGELFTSANAPWLVSAVMVPLAGVLARVAVHVYKTLTGKIELLEAENKRLALVEKTVGDAANAKVAEAVAAANALIASTVESSNQRSRAAVDDANAHIRGIRDQCEARVEAIRLSCEERVSAAWAEQMKDHRQHQADISRIYTGAIDREGMVANSMGMLETLPDVIADGIATMRDVAVGEREHTVALVRGLVREAVEQLSHVLRDEVERVSDPGRISNHNADLGGPKRATGNP